jgi:membrane-associated HD superfamily phosphohydrolase
MITHYQYVKAVNAAGGDKSQVDIEKFRYPGPRPRSRETAILLLADGSEARVRAEKPKDEAELRKLIKEAIDQRVALGQLDDTNLTLKDLSTILDSFTTTLRGIYHPRVKYPVLDNNHEGEKTTPIYHLPDTRETAEIPAEPAELPAGYPPERVVQSSIKPAAPASE